MTVVWVWLARPVLDPCSEVQGSYNSITAPPPRQRERELVYSELEDVNLGSVVCTSVQGKLTSVIGDANRLRLILSSAPFTAPDAPPSSSSRSSTTS